MEILNRGTHKLGLCCNWLKVMAHVDVFMLLFPFFIGVSKRHHVQSRSTVITLLKQKLPLYRISWTMLQLPIREWSLDSGKGPIIICVPGIITSQTGQIKALYMLFKLDWFLYKLRVSKCMHEQVQAKIFYLLVCLIILEVFCFGLWSSVNSLCSDRSFASAFYYQTKHYWISSSTTRGID